MRYSFISAAILALTSSVFAQTANFDPIFTPTQDQQVPAGSNLEITWEPSPAYPGPITITLLQGATPSTLELGQTITAGLDQTKRSYTWAVPSDIKSFATYGFKITLDSDPSVFQFSFPFHITGLSSTSSASGSAPAVASYSASETGATTTVHLSSASSYAAVPTSYVAVPTSSASSSSVVSSVNSSSTYAASSTVVVVKPTTYAPSASPVPTTMAGSGNATLSTTLKPSVSATKSASSTSSGPAQATSNSAVANAARGGLAVIGGVVLALAL